MSVNLGNLSDYFLVPDYLLKDYMMLTTLFDKEWTPYLTQLMPRVAAPGQGSKRYWTEDSFADPQGMAKFYADDETIEPMNYPHISPISFVTRMLGNAFRRGKRTFAEDFKNGIIEQAHAEMLENLINFINRSIEYILTRFAYGSQPDMTPFTNQNTNRQAIVNLINGTFNGVASAGLGGTAWSNFAAGTPTIFEDLAYMKKQYARMVGKRARYLMIGRETEYNLELNDDILDRLIRIQDTTQGVLGENLQGLNLIKIMGQTYKEIPGADVTGIGMPGEGDYLPQDWTRLNKIDMMTEQIGGNVYEWGIIGGENIGSIQCGWVDEDHKAYGSPTNIFIEQIEDKRPKQVWTEARIQICPKIRDFAEIMLVRGMAIQQD